MVDYGCGGMSAARAGGDVGAGGASGGCGGAGEAGEEGLFSWGWSDVGAGGAAEEGHVVRLR